MRRRTCIAGSLAALVRVGGPLAVLPLGGCGDRDGATRLAGATMGTRWQVSLAATLSAVQEQAVARAAADALARVEARMSTWLAGSDLSRFNAAPRGRWMPVPGSLVEVVGEARRIAALSGGAFDPTVGPLVDLWGFGPSTAGGVPRDEALADARARTGLAAVFVDRGRSALRKEDDRIALDLCGIAKGYAVDRVAAALDAAGLEDYLVDVGGELRARGRAPHGGPWRVGVERPAAGGVEIGCVLALDAGAVATSGDYRNFFEHAGRRYSHTIDPRTGVPVSHALAAVSVIAPTAMAADALSTALMVLGPQEGPDLAERLSVPALFQVRGDDGLTGHTTAGFRERVAGGPAPGARYATRNSPSRA